MTVAAAFPVDAAAQVSAIEGAMGDPRSSAGVMRFADIVADEQVSRVTPALRRLVLDDLGLALALVPEVWGGASVSPAHTAAMLKALFRRDPAAGAELGALAVVGSAGAWSHAGAGDLARELLSTRPIAVTVDPGDAVVGETATGVLPLVAVPLEARRILVRSGDVARLVAVNETLAVVTPRATTGLRGLRFCALELRDAPVVATWQIDPAADVAARAILASAWCGAVDSALRLAVVYARERALYGATVWDLPHARGLIADAFVDLLIADAIATAAREGGRPDALEVVPGLLGGVMRALSVLFGSTFFARVDPFAVFETLVRDVASMRLLAAPLVTGGGASGDARLLATPSDVELSVEEKTAGESEEMRRALRARVPGRLPRGSAAIDAGAIEHLVTEAARRVDAGLSLTWDETRVFPSGAEGTSHPEREPQ